MNKLYPENCIQDIASVIKEKTGDNSLMTVGEMASKIQNIKCNSQKLVPASWKNQTSDACKLFVEIYSENIGDWIWCSHTNISYKSMRTIISSDNRSRRVEAEVDGTVGYIANHHEAELRVSKAISSCSKGKNIAVMQGANNFIRCGDSVNAAALQDFAYPFDVLVFTSFSNVGMCVYYSIPRIAIVCIHESPCLCPNASFGRDIGDLPVYVPDSAINTYKQTTNWSNVSNFRPLSEFDGWDEDF